MTVERPLDLQLHLNRKLVEKNKQFVLAVRLKRPVDDLILLQSEIQELYNHIQLLRNFAN